MDQEYPFRPRGKHGFDRTDVINYITQAKLQSTEHLAHIEELEAAKSAWHTQAKNLEREKAALASRNRELEEQLERVVVSPENPGGEWLPPEEFSAAELAALKARCLELDNQLSEQKQFLAQTQHEKTALQQEIETLQQELESLPRFAMDKQEIDALREQITTLEAEKAAYAGQLPALQEQLAKLGESAEQIAGLEAAKAAIAAELDATKAQLDTALQEHLSKLAESAEEITALESANAALAAQLDSAGSTTSQELAAREETIAALEREKDDLAQRAEALQAAHAQTQQQFEAIAAECEQLRRRQNEIELERQSAASSEDTLRSMVMSSFNYANLYVENNLKTAELISEATSRNIGHVSDSAASLLDQVEAISRSFDDTTNHIRRNLTVFQQELAGIQSGMNRRLSKDRFKALLDENDKLRESLENELIAELSSDDETPPVHYEPQHNPGAAPQLPFAEDLPPSYHTFLDE